MQGSLITFEGMDGSGKTTQIHLLENEFTKLGVEYKTYREPGGTELSEKIRTILLDKENIELISIAESFLFAASRAQLTSEQIKPAMKEGKFVICDRFTDSTIVYQGYGRGLDIKILEEINHIATAGLTPDITFILDIKPEVAVARMKSKSPDRMEATGMEFFRRIREGYRQINRKNSNRYIVINGEESPENVFKEIIEIVMNKFKEVLT